MLKWIQINSGLTKRRGEKKSRDQLGKVCCCWATRGRAGSVKAREMKGVFYEEGVLDKQH